MCGIAGIISKNMEYGELETVGNTMAESLSHRGPDGSGIWINKIDGLMLAHRRLAIQDLSDSGKQPMFSRSKRYCVVFNGEIYNFKEIEKKLINCGHNFIGHSDTEVLLATVEEWGIEKATNQFIGMFAFALWDNKDKSIYLCRDRLGEKPLYYGWLGNTFYFSSELKAIEKVAPPGLLEIDNQGLSVYFRYGYIPAPYSIYRGIYKLPPGTTLSLPINAHLSTTQFSPWPDSSVFSPKRYWSVFEVAQYGLSNILQDEIAAVTELDELLHKTVRRQMIADVKLGMFLSGGIDSTLVTAIAQSEASENVRTYTIGFSEKEYDESRYAEKIAQHIGTSHLTVPVSPADALQVIPGLSSIYDEPFADSSQIPTYLVSKIAQEHVTVCLSGDGGDELFAGYNRYFSLEKLWKNINSIPLPIRKMFGRLLATPSPMFWDQLYSIFTTTKGKDLEKQKLIGLKFQKLAGLIQQQDLMHGYEYLLSYWHQPENLLLRQHADTEHNDVNLPENANFIETAMYLDQIGYLPGDNLAKVDRASMAVSLETRLPLLSHELVELSWRIPTSMKVRDKTSKWILRQVLSKYVPSHLIERPKMGFSVPVAQWLRGELREWAEDLINSIKTSGCELIREETVRMIWNEHISGKRDHSHRLWTVLMFISWLNNRALT